MSQAFWVALLALALAAAGARAAEEPLPAPRIPPYDGQRYVSRVPDTLDLAERMKLCINGFTRAVGPPARNPFPTTRYPCHHFVQLSDAPHPVVTRSVLLYGKFMFGAALARIATGDTTNLQVDEDWRQGWFDWNRVNEIMHGPEGGRRLQWIAANYLREKDPAWLQLGKQAVARLSEAAAPCKDGAWLHPGLGNTPPDDGLTDWHAAIVTSEAIAAAKAGGPQGLSPWEFSFMGWTVQGLCALHRATGIPEARALAGRLARFIKDDAGIFSSDGHLLAGHPYDTPVVHFHHCVNCAEAMLEYGLISGEREYVDFARRVYDHLMTFCNRDIGFAPEYAYGKYPRTQDFDNTEACCTADLVLLALRLTEAGAGDYWDDVDRFVRNQLAALQLTDTRWFYDLPESRKQSFRFPNPDVEAGIGPYVGHFAGWASVNEWHCMGPGIMTCCLGNSTQALYFVWERIIERTDQGLVINLLLNRASPWADVKSCVPYEGKITIELKQAVPRVLVRLPEWVEPARDRVVCLADGQSIQPAVRGRWLDLGAARAGQVLVVSFPISVRTVEREIGRRTYNLTIKGNTVVAVDPPGERMPLYQRSTYLQDHAPEIAVMRYVAADVLRLGYGPANPPD